MQEGTERAPETGGRKPAVLVVEDERGIRTAVRKYLTGRGFEVLEAETAEEALDVAREADRPIDVLFEEIVVPDALGPPLAESLRIIHPGITVIYTSGRAPDDPVLREAMEGDTPFLRKPFRPRALAEMIRDVLEDRSTGAD